MDFDSALIKENETLDDLQRNGLRIIQRRDGFRFCTDSVLLADFCMAKKSDRVVDMGTGSGVIPLLLAGRSCETQIDGVELQPDIAEMARRSVRLNGLTDRIRIHTMDVREAKRQLGAACATLVVSNPPYTQRGNGLESPDESRAIARGSAGGCPLVEWIAACAALLQSGGRLCVVFPAPGMLMLCDSMRSAGVEPKRLRFVCSRIEKPPKLLLLEGYRQGRPGLRILPPLVTHDENGNYSEEMRRIYGETG